MTKLEGGCACGATRYTIRREPMIVHCCHCLHCQRETGSAFVLNAVIEADAVDVEGKTPDMVLTPSESGRGQPIARCPDCKVALWSHYSAGEVINFMRVGTLDEPGRLRPDVHIYTSTKQPWVKIDDGTPSFEGFYTPGDVWSAETMDRWKAATAPR